MFVIVTLHVAITWGFVYWWQSQQAQNARAPRRLAWQSPASFQTGVTTSTTSTRIAAAKSGRASAKQAAATLPPVSTPEVPKATLVAPPPSASEPPAPKAALVAGPADQHRMEPVPNVPGSSPLFASSTPPAKPSANRSITLRRMRSKPSTPVAGKTPAPPMSSPSLLDIARLNSMRPNALPKPGMQPLTDDIDDNTALDPVDEAVNAAFLHVWTAPPIDAVPAEQREARVNLSLGRDGSVLKCQMSKFSHSHQLDQSILDAITQVKKIPVALPSNFTKDSYDVELNFLLLP